jgi:hypothetical protein
MPTSHRRAVPPERKGFKEVITRFAQRRFPFGNFPNNAAFYFFSLSGVVIFVAGLVDLIFLLKPPGTSAEIAGVGFAFVVIAWMFFGR